MKLLKTLKHSWTVAAYRIAAICLLGGVILGLASSVAAQDWNGVDVIQHSDYQAVNADGTSAYNGSFPIRLRGVVLNNTEQWLDATSDYDPGVHLGQMGGESEFYVQAVDLDGTPWDPDASQPFDDFGGTACWMGQNCGNYIGNMNPIYSYTEAAWYAELDRLHLHHPEPPPVAPPLLRAGDLVEIRTRGGLYYKGKMNVNEQHSNDPDNNFEIEVLQPAHGLPAPTAITLSDIKDAGNVDIFDPARQTGGERYQSTLVEIEGVRFEDTVEWGSDGSLVLEDATGRTLPVHLGLDGSFDLNPAPNGFFDIVGIMDQANHTGLEGYGLLVMSFGDITPVPEPATIVLLCVAAALVLGRIITRRRYAIR